MPGVLFFSIIKRPYLSGIVHLSSANTKGDYAGEHEL